MPPKKPKDAGKQGAASQNGKQDANGDRPLSDAELKDLKSSGKGKSKPSKLPHRSGKGKAAGRNTGMLIGAGGGGCALGGALLWAWWARLPPPPPTTAAVVGAADTPAHRAGARFASPLPDPQHATHACDAIRPLWGNLSCDDFLLRHWERSPRLARPGPAWTSELMTRPDVATMIGMWPFRIHKNHATVGFHVPDSGFLHDERWKRNDSVPANAVEVALAHQRTLVMHNLEVYWAPIGRLAAQLVTFFCSYTQVNFYGSPPGLKTATAPPRVGWHPPPSPPPCLSTAPRRPPWST